MAVYILLALTVLILGPWLVGFAVSAWLDARRPHEAEAPPGSSGEDRLATVQRLTDEWQQVRQYWVHGQESDDDRRAA